MKKQKEEEVFVVKHKYDAPGINSRTARTKNRLLSQIEWLYNVLTDKDKVARAFKQLCPVCFHTHKICGQGFTAFTCQICSEEKQWHNTCVPVLCNICAVRNDLCQNCGADRELERRVS